jgi:hypothetical protein
MQYWWVSPAFALVSAMLLAVTVRAGAGLFAARRERMLALVEGRG